MKRRFQHPHQCSLVWLIFRRSDQRVRKRVLKIRLYKMKQLINAEEQKCLRVNFRPKWPKRHRKVTCASGSVGTRGVYKNGNCQDSCQTSTFVQLRPLWYQTLIEPLSFVHLFRSSNCVVSLHANAQCGWRLFHNLRLYLDFHLLDKIYPSKSLPNSSFYIFYQY